MNRFYRQYQFARIARGAILDIGSGSNPFWRANVLMERFIDDDSQRPGKLIIDRSIVCGDIHDIPFIDNAFSFVHCSHLLEHLEKPEKAIDELTRVAKSGYIETPSEIHEFLDLNFPFHRWAVSMEDDCWVFREKPQVTATHPLVEALKRNNNWTRKCIRMHHDQINLLSRFWHDTVSYRIERCEQPIVPYDTEHEAAEASEFAVNPKKQKLKLLLGRLLSPTINLHDILACPICKQHIAVVSSDLVCNHCGVKYPVINNIPMLTREHAAEI